MTHALTQAAARRAAIHDRLSCDLCGSDTAELREIHPAPQASIWCAACFGHHDEAEFTDFPLAQGAAQ